MRMFVTIALLAVATPALAFETVTPPAEATTALERAPKEGEVLRDTSARIVGKVYKVQASGNLLAIVNRETVRIPASTLSIVNGKLVEAGLVERRSDPADRRAHRIWLTPAIEPLIGELTRIGAAEEAAALAGFDAQEQALLHAMLDRITANLGGDAVEAVTCEPERR